MKKTWSAWLPFPNPANKGYISAPFGPGVYELRLAGTKEKILYGRSKNVAYRMTSLLPNPEGSGSRGNPVKLAFISEHRDQIEYRTVAAIDEADAARIEAGRKLKGPWRFPS